MKGVITCVGEVSGISASLAWTLLGDGGWTRTVGLVGGVGGYECGDASPASVASESIEALDNDTDARAFPGCSEGGFVRQANVRAASA